MKIKIKQTFRSMWATILAVLMLLSTFSAVAVTLNKQDTGANIDIVSSGYTVSKGTKIYFDATDILSNNTNIQYIYFAVSNSDGGTTSNNYTLFEMTKVGSSNLYYHERIANSTTTNDATTFFATTSSWGTSVNNGGSYDNMQKYGAWVGEKLTRNYGASDTIFVKPNGTQNGSSLTVSSTVNPSQKASLKVDKGTGSYNTYSSGNPGTITSSGQSVTNGAFTTVSATSTDTNPDAIINACKTSTVTLTYTPTDSSYEFVGWSTSSSESDITSRETSMTYTVSNSTDSETKYYALVKKSTSNPCVFKAGSSLYFDFGKCTGYNGGANLLSTGRSDYINYGKSTYVNYQDSSYFEGFKTGVVEVVLAKDYTVKPGEFLFKCAASGNWETVNVSTLPTEGQNMIIVDKDGKGYSWGTYGATSPVATALSVTATPNPCYVNEEITLDKTVTLTTGVNEGNVTYSYEYSTDNSTWNAISGTRFTPSSAGTYYFRVKASAEGYEDFISKNEAKVTVSNRMYNITKAGTTNGSFDTEPASEASAGATVTINITPNPGYEVNAVQVVKTGEGSDGQTVAFSGSGNTYTFQMPEYDVTVSVTFKLKAYTMTGKADPSTFDSYVKCYDASDAEISTATKGQTVKFVANAVSGYSVTGWTVTGVTEDKYTVSSDKKSVEVTVETSNVTATANYVGDSYTVTQKTSSNGTYTVTGVTAGKAQYGSPVTINPEPATGFVLDSITVNKTGDVTTTVPVNNNSFTMPAYNVTITVKFKTAPVDKGTLLDGYKVLYTTNNNSNPDSLTNVLSNSKVYLKDGVYTAYISGEDLDKLRAIDGRFYVCISSDTTYKNMLSKGSTSAAESTTDTPDYIDSLNVQSFNADQTTYRHTSVRIKDNSVNQVTISYNSTSPQYIINGYAESTEVTYLAESVTLEATHTTQVIGKKVTLRATLNDVNAKIPTGAEFKYTFKCGSNVEEEVIVTKTENGPYVATCTVSSDTPGIQSYTVTVSTKESDIVNYTPTDYESVTSNTVNVEYRDVIYYYAAVNPDTGAVDTRNAIPADNKVETTVSDGGTYYFSVFDNDTDTSAESVVDYTVDSANNRYCTISKSSTETGLDYLIVKCNAKCSNPVIYFDKANKKVYAVATQNIGSEKTLESKKTVTYYFAEEYSDSTSLSDPSGGGNGMRIKYWNNSVDNSGYTDVTTPVGSDGKETTALSGNSIFVRVDKFAGVSDSTFPYWKDQLQRKFYIYSVKLPIWATSFNFVSSSNTDLTVDNTSQIGKPSCSSIVLNPNRIYCLLRYNSVNYVRGVVLDESMWSDETRGTIKSNEVTTQGFASNLVNYKTETNEKLGNIGFNTALTAKYGTDYEHPLYFNGWYNTEDESANSLKSIYGTTHFKLHDNLAMRYNKDAKSYFASIQNLTDNRLSTTKKNEMGNGYLLGYNGALMPLFDYKMLNNYKTTLVNGEQLYENVQFPFYASTFNGVTTYSYDSTTDRNRVVKTTDDGKTTVNVSNGFVKPEKSSSYGYFPFEGTTSTNTYGFGTEFDINFYMTNNGKLSNGDDIAFNFSGDDDVWVYVDGVRVLDLGGAHSVSSGTINFSDMKVYYKTAANATDNVKSCREDWAISSDYVKTVSLKDLFEANGATFSNTDASTQHTLQMFYLERGQGESNCSISFNLPQNTGFRVNSNVTTNNVNEALVQDTMASANKDYFNYQIANKLASDDEYSKITAKFPKAHTPATNADALTKTDLPNYPIKSLLISRKFLGSQYFLTATGATTSSSYNKWMTDNQWLNSKNNGLFTTLKNVNYTLSDAYAVKATSTEETSPSGRVSESGIFNLLFGQSALFESKIPSNTLVQLSQEDTISKVNAGDGDTTVITAGDDSTKTVSNYYSSSYTIVDDNTGDEIGSGKKSAGSAGSFYADDASSNKDMFYFANYSGDANTSSNAMTVTYTNDVLTSKIKLAKYVKENPSATDNFYFKVEFSKIFGETFATAKEYPDLQYTVYNSSNGDVVATRTYGKAGVYFTANQYAIIEGVPVDSKYNVVEKDRAGYKFESASKTTYNGNTAGDPVSDTKNSVEGETVIGADGTTTYDEITFTNSKQAFTVKFKYYDRAVVSGKASHISTSPTTVTYSFASINEFTSETNNVTTYNLERIISKAYSEYNFDNVIDTYTSFTSQTEAETEAGNFKVIRERIPGVEPGVTTYSQAYGSEEGVDLGFHYDCYGRPQGTADCKVRDREKWVTYYSGNTEIAESEASLGTSKVDSITVWLYNTLKEYTPTFFYASKNAASGELTAVEGSTDKYVATTNTSHTIPKDVYYNVRLGGVNGNTLNDAATEYLNEYGITKGYCEEVPNIVTDVTYTDEKSNKKSLKFLYWASDPRGKTILSTDVAYGYRVTNNLKAYAVYGVNDFNAKGLTITPNTPDYYSNSNGKALVRLNNVMNVYGCPERDTNIKNASIIYIIDYSPVVNGKTQMDNLIDAGGFDELQAKVREVLKANEKSDSFLDSENIVIVDVTKVIFEKKDYGDIDITGFNHKVVPYNEAITATDEIKLTNKNRVQFTTSFTKSNLSNYKMYAMLGMDYSEVVSGKNDGTNSWIVSDNLLYYAFDENGNVSSIKDPILKHEFYNPTTAS